MNPFNLTYEHVISILNLSSEWYRPDLGHVNAYEVQYMFLFSWGYILEIESANDRVFHEINVNYGCPSGYSRAKQIAWLRQHNYPFEIEGY